METRSQAKRLDAQAPHRARDCGVKGCKHQATHKGISKALGTFAGWFYVCDHHKKRFAHEMRDVSPLQQPELTDEAS